MGSRAPLLAATDKAVTNPSRLGKRVVTGGQWTLRYG
jgi:hypothetical protein